MIRSVDKFWASYETMLTNVVDKRKHKWIEQVVTKKPVGERDHGT